MTSNKNDDEIVKFSQKNLRQDILLFKEEVLKDIKTVQRDFSNKFNKMEDILKEQINIYESKVGSLDHKIKNLSNLISNDRSLITKIEELDQFKEETKGKLITDSIRLSNIETDFKINIKNIEQILSSSVIYPGIIGYSGKFKSFHDYMDYVLDQISDLNSFKERSSLDLLPYKKKIDESLEYIKVQVNHIINTSNEFTIKSINDSEQRMRSLIHLYDDRLQDTRVENAHYSIGLEKKSEDLSRLIKNVYEIKADIYKKVKDEVNSVKGDQKTLLRLITSYKKEFGYIKDKFMQLSEFIRDVRFRANISSDAQKKEYVSMSKKISYKKNENSSYSNRKKTDYIRADTFELNNKNLNNNYEMFDSPYSNISNKYAKTFNYAKRNSMHIGSTNQFSKKYIQKFETSNNSKEDIKNKKPKTNSSRKLIKINPNFENEIKGIKLTRRNTTAINLPNNFHKDFSEKKNFNFNSIFSNNEILTSKKDKEEIYLYSSKSNSEDRSKSDCKDKDKDKNKTVISLKKNNNKKNNQYIIKEEDENISEITEDYNKQKSKKEINNIKEESKSKNTNTNSISKDSQINNDIKAKNNCIINKNNKLNKEDEQKNEKLEMNNDKKLKNDNNNDKNKKNNNNIDNNNNDKNTDIKINNGENDDKNNIKTLTIKPNSSKIFNKHKQIRLQALNEINNNNIKEIERNNTVNIVDMNEMFVNSNRINRRIQYLKSPSNLIFAISPENHFLKKSVIANPKSIKNKSNPSLLSKSNKIKINASLINNKNKKMIKNDLITKRYVENIDIQTIDYFENSDKPYKTYSSFPQLTLDGSDAKTQFNHKIIFLNNKKNKRINEIARQFLDKKIKKIGFNQGPNIFNPKTINVLKERINNGDNK